MSIRASEAHSPAMKRCNSSLTPIWGVGLALLFPLAAVGAQGVSAAGIRGSVRTDGAHTADARVRVSHDATGFSVEVRATGGRFLVQGLEPGGPYTVSARALGFAPRRMERVVLHLGELRELDFVLEPFARRRR